jgi:aminoglycoside phosphotransferase (APT) family kinase protein
MEPRERAIQALEKIDLEPSSVQGISDDAGRMKQIFKAETGRRGEVGVYIYGQEQGGERGRTIQQRMDAEIYSFRRIRNQTSLRSPKPLYNNGEDIAVCTWLEGQNTGHLIEKERDSERLARLLGSGLAEIHSIQYQNFGEFGADGIEQMCSTWPEYLERILDFLKRFDPPKPARDGISYLENNLNQVPESFQPVHLHGDFHAWNTLVDSSGGLGVVDCEAGFAGCREFEVTRAINHWAQEYSVTEPFLEAYGKENLAEDWRSRTDFYDVLHATMGIIDGIRMSSESLVEMNREILTDFLEG